MCMPIPCHRTRSPGRSIDVDGSDHLTVQGRARDAQRDRYFRELGYETLRFHGFEITQDIDSVRARIVAAVQQRLGSD
ncbi:DUF559 domain-containing protein [Roseimaritima sediminicola]|uniref:DUF559 domain-containing protein n=1 Tax=Roseimaritima sediminicola TaxID=2662066 RepID=UPI0036F2A707